MDVINSRPCCQGLATRPFSISQHRFSRGVTLLELLLALTLLSILFSVAIPSFNDLIEHERLVTQLDTLAGALQLARSAAITHGQPAILCKSADGQHCGKKVDWSDGWLLFVYKDCDRHHDADEAVIRVHGPLQHGATLQFRAFYTSRYVLYHPSGAVLNNGTFTLCSDDSAKALILSRTGRLRVSKRSSNGGPLSCG